MISRFTFYVSRHRIIQRFLARFALLFVFQAALGQFAQGFDGLGGVQVLGAGIDAVEDGMAAVDAITLHHIFQALGGDGVARVQHPQEGFQQGVGADVLLVQGDDLAGGVAGPAHDAGFGVVESFHFGRADAEFLVWSMGRGHKPGFDPQILLPEAGAIHHQVLDDGQIGQRPDR